jgi:DNA-binding IclR family transcriptional regulator
MVVDVLPASYEFSIVPAVGSSLPVHLGASGKALIAYLSDQELSNGSLLKRQITLCKMSMLFPILMC